jgi:hypothetical protein
MTCCIVIALLWAATASIKTCFLMRIVRRNPATQCPQSWRLGMHHGTVLSFPATSNEQHPSH